MPSYRYEDKEGIVLEIIYFMYMYIVAPCLGRYHYWVPWVGEYTDKKGECYYSYCMNTALLVWIFVTLWVINNDG